MPIHFMRGAMLLPTLILCTGTATAAPDCKNAMTTIEINDCADAELKTVEKKLNTTYQAALKAVGRADGAGTRQALVAAERAWIKYREADCKALYELWSGGTMSTGVYLGCMRRRAEQRINELDEFANPH